MKKALITGSTGFVGKHLQTELQGAGYAVAGLGRQAGVAGEYYQADVTNQAALSDAMRRAQPTHIFHLAGLSPGAAADSAEFERVNVGGAKNLLEAAAALPQPPVVLIAGSSHVYGHPEYLPMDEKHPLGGEGAYAASRVAQEALLPAYAKRVSVMMTRSFNHTGPGQSDQFVIPKIIRQVVEIKHGKRSGITMGDPDIRRDLLDVRDVARAYRMLAEQPHAGLIVNVCRGQSTALNNVIETARIEAGLASIEVITEPKFLRPDDPPDLYGSPQLLQSLTDFTPQISLTKLVRDLMEYWTAQLL